MVSPYMLFITQLLNSLHGFSYLRTWIYAIPFKYWDIEVCFKTGALRQAVKSQIHLTFFSSSVMRVGLLQTFPETSSV